MANEKRLIDAIAYCKMLREEMDYLLELDKTKGYKTLKERMGLEVAIADLGDMPTVDAVILPCKVGDTVYGKFWNYGEEVHECKVTKSKVCQFRDGTLHYFLDLEFSIIDYYYNDGRLMRCQNQAVFGEDFGSWNRVYLSREEAEAALAKMDGDGNEAF